MKFFVFIFTVFWICSGTSQAQSTPQVPSGVELVRPIRKNSFNNEGACPERRQGGNPRTVSGYQVFSASMDGNRQVYPQIAVGGGYILEGTNSGLLIFTKAS